MQPSQPTPGATVASRCSSPGRFEVYRADVSGSGIRLGGGLIA